MSTLIRGLFAQIHVVKALIIRETQTRFGKNAIGYLWAFFEPLMWIGTFMALFYFGKRQIPNGMDTVGFLATGLMPFLIFRSTVTRTMNAISANKGLLYYPQIRPLDLMLSRSILELATLSLVFAILLTGNMIYMEHLPLENLLMIIAGIFGASILGTGLGMTAGSLITLSPAVERMVSPFLRPLFWLSGAFFTAGELPSALRNILLWNPLLHLTELTRDGWYGSFDSTYWDMGYVGLWVLALSFIGLTLERVARRRLEA